MAGTIVADTHQSSTSSPPTFTNSSGTAIGTLCRAWVNWDGTSASPGAGRGSFNVSSITKNATGDYTINFTTAMPDANYASIGMQSVGSGGGQPQGMMGLFNGTAPTASSSGRFIALNNVFSSVDPLYCSAAFFR